MSVSVSIAVAKRHIQNIIYYDKNCRNLWPDFNMYFTNEVNNFIDNKKYVTPSQLNGLIGIDIAWENLIKRENFINPFNNQIVSVSNNKNQIHTYNKVVKISKKNISKNTNKISDFFSKL